METTTINIINRLQRDGAESATQMLDALSDGEYLQRTDWTQEEVETAHAEISELKQKIEKKFGLDQTMRLTDFTPGFNANFWGHGSCEITAEELFLGVTLYFSLPNNDMSEYPTIDQFLDSLEAIN